MKTYGIKMTIQIIGYRRIYAKDKEEATKKIDELVDTFHLKTPSLKSEKIIIVEVVEMKGEN